MDAACARTRSPTVAEVSAPRRNTKVVPARLTMPLAIVVAMICRRSGWSAIARRTCSATPSDPAAAASMANLSISTLVRRTAEVGVRTLGPEALVEGERGVGDGRLAALTRASAGSTVAGGAAEIQRRVIARKGLGCAA